MNTSDDTICAIATAVGGAVAIVRISGNDAYSLASSCWKGTVPLEKLPARVMYLGAFSGEHGVIDPSCIAVRMPGPHSYTGEDVLEFHCHGGAVCTRAILRELLARGIRHAEPGEFSRRAFMNGKMDLTQAEAVSDMITAGSDAALRLAGQQLSGEMGRRISAVEDALNDILAEVESFLDFPEEEIDWKPAENIAAALEKQLAVVDRLAASRDEGEIMRGGVSLIIAGPPNAGKSSLLNQMLGRDRAIVSDIPGTTRDTIEASVQFRGIPFKLMDTAGVHDSAADSVEADGIARTEAAAADADLVIWMSDIREPVEWPGWNIRGKVLCVYNKADISEVNREGVCISALTGEGMEALYSAMEEAVLGRKAGGDGDIAVAARHAALLTEAAGAIRTAIPHILLETWELGAIELRNAISALGQITGKTVVPDVLDTIFSKFCIGK